jgi:Zn-dependent peptidase ImmA (M78 family)
LFKENLKKVKSLAALQPNDFFSQLQLLCTEAGVKVVHTPCLPGATLHGSTHWMNDNPVIQLSNRYARNDIFWFKFFHEAGHILKHGKRSLFIEGLEYTEQAREKEQEADAVAIEYTLSLLQENEIKQNLPLSKEAIVHFATKFNTHPACIIGRFARKMPKLNMLGWKYSYFQKIEL